MTNRRFKIIRFLAFTTLATVIFLMAAVAIIIVFNIQSPLIPNIVPVDQTHEKIIRIYYPNQQSSVQSFMRIDAFSGKVYTDEMVSVDIYLRYDGTLAEGTPVQVTANGYLYPSGKDLISGFADAKNKTLSPKTVLVGFEGASLYNKPDEPGSFFLTLYDSQMKKESNLSELRQGKIAQVIMWDTQGDFYPYLSIPLNTNGTSITQVFPGNGVHVSGLDIIRQEKYAKISTVLTIVLFVFTLITSVELLWKLRPELISNFFGIKQNSENREDHGTPNTKHNPDDYQESSKVQKDMSEDHTGKQKKKHR